LTTQRAFWDLRLFISFNYFAFCFKGILIEKVDRFEVVLNEDASF
jgi:hypothetical protein